VGDQWRSYSCRVGQPLSGAFQPDQQVNAPGVYSLMEVFPGRREQRDVSVDAQIRVWHAKIGEFTLERDF
jgi:hypothetical protein